MNFYVLEYIFSLYAYIYAQAHSSPIYLLELKTKTRLNSVWKIGIPLVYFYCL